MYGGRYHYCHPLSFQPHPSKLYRNDGNARFTDISEASGIAQSKGKVFGAVATDVNNDGWLDLFVANDSVANFLFVNKGSESSKRLDSMPVSPTHPTGIPGRAWA
jgi:hypothetical protein